MSDPWNCPVCYCSTDSNTGTVSPKCKHTICLPCYSEIRDRKLDPECVLCRHKYYERPMLQLVERQNVRQQNELLPNAYAEWQDAPILLRAHLEYPSFIRPIVPSNPNTMRRDLRRQLRNRSELPMSKLTYRDIMRLLEDPVSYDETIIPLAAIRDQFTRVRQARILGLKAATDKQKALSVDLANSRSASSGVSTGTERAASVKNFFGQNPPTRKFRLGDTHTRANDGVKGLCIGHHLWQYEDGKRIRKGVTL